SDRQALANPGGRQVDRQTQVRLAVRRHRVRAQLAKVVEGFLALPPVVRIWAWVRRNSDAVSTAVSASPMLIVAVLPLMVGGASTPNGREPSDRVSAPTAVHVGAPGAALPRVPHAVVSRPMRASAVRSTTAVVHSARTFRARVVVDPPGPVPRTWVGEWKKRPEDHLACVSVPGVVPMTCVG